MTQVSGEGSHLLDDSLVGAVVLTQENATRVFCGIVLIQPVQQRHVQIALPCKFAVHKWTQLHEWSGEKSKVSTKKDRGSSEYSYIFPLHSVQLHFVVSLKKGPVL